MTSEVSRRDFLKASAAGAGFVLTFRIAGGAMSAAEAAGAWEPNTVFTIDPSGIITVHITKAEIGAGRWHRARADRRRGAGGGLAGHPDRLPDQRPQVRPHADRRQLERELDVRRALAGGRRGAPPPDRSRREAYERAGVGVHRRGQQGPPSAVR